ncbi:S8 family serine peptidase [Rossellomorea sp. BNER]|uniref:S8 family serine peptidase n=1 Tax=Rossellomorea sp. BNER TaxID=2962031 RepID=UPI003AF241F0|nr:S8 family serine peptidase [Rossellomorea sp. BNER]
MKKKWTLRKANKMAIPVLAGVVALGGFIPSMQYSRSVQAKTAVTAENVLNVLSPEQRRALHELTNTGKGGIHLPSSMNLSSNKEISVIVEFKGHAPNTAVLLEKLKGKKLSINEAKERVKNEHRTFKKDLDSLKVKGKVTAAYQESYNGVALTLSASDVKKLMKSNVVKNVWENKKVELVRPLETEENQGGTYTGEHPHTTMGVDKLHEQGITGEGIKVAVLDTGIDYNHPDLKDAYKGGYDFVDNDEDPMETTYKEWQESKKPQFQGSGSYYTSHGTHVSGIIAGQGENDSSYAMNGVAPDVDLHVYRVLGPYGIGTTDDIIAGIEQAITDKMDIINLSLGNNLNDPLSPLSVAINNAVLSGVTSVLAAGNMGSGMYSVGSPATSPLAITVGSTNTEVSYPNFEGSFDSESSQQPTEIRHYTTGMGMNPRSLKGETYPVVDAGLGLEEDYHNLDVRDKIVLVKTGSLRINEKVSIAKDHGAKAVFVYSPYPGYIADMFPEDVNLIPSFILEGTQAQGFQKILQTEEATFTFKEIKEKVVVKDDTLSYFSSRGPSRVTYDIKPEIIAPGGSILSTVPNYHRGQKSYEYAYDKFSGTSMATPQISGVAALLLQANPKYGPEDLKAALMNTADPIETNHSVYEVGAGRVDALEAVKSTGIVQIMDETTTIRKGEKETIQDITGALSFGTLFEDGTHHREHRSVILKNLSDEKKTFSVDVSFNVDIRGSKDGRKNGVTLSVPDTISIKAKKEAKSSVFLTVPKSAEDGTYEGYVTYTNTKDENETYQVPFAVRKVKQGVDYVQSTNTLSTLRENGYVFKPSLSGEFSLHSHMRNVDLFLVDVTTGKEIGFIGNLDGAYIPENTPIKLYGYFDGNYYPFTNDPDHPLAYEPIVATPGSYKIKFVFTNDNEEETIIEKPVVIDEEMPEIQTDTEGRIIEVNPEHSSVQIRGKVKDLQIEEAKALGIDVNQGNNDVLYKNNNSFPQTLPVQSDGSFEYVRSFPSYLETMPVSLTGKDRAGVNSIQKEFFFIRTGTPYLSTMSEQNEMKSGQSVHFTSSAHHYDAWEKLEFSYIFDKENIEVVNVKLSEQVEDTVLLEKKETEKGLFISLKAKNGEIESIEKLSLLDVEVKVKDEDFYSSYFKLNASGLKITKTDGTTVSSEVISPSIKVWSHYSELKGNINGEAVYLRDGFGKLLTPHIDYPNLGATIKAIDKDGNEYDAKVIDDAQFLIKGLPSKQEKMTFMLDIPGHFTVLKTFTIGREEDYGEQQFLDFSAAIAGDVNKDNVIDIEDALYLEKHWGTSNRNGDINFDGVIDSSDMKFIEKNYLMENPNTPTSKDPSDKKKGRTLEDIIKGL